MKVIWYKTASIKIICDKNEILFDPYIGINRSKELLNNFSNINNIFITHNHLDHVSSVKDIYKVNNKVKIYGTYSSIKSLRKDKINKNNLKLIKVHDKYKFNNISVEVLDSKHIRFNCGIFFKTLFSVRVIKYFNNLKQIIRDNFKYRESGECICYKVSDNNHNILVLGSMNLNKNEDYNNIDVLIMAYQGRSDLCKKSIKVINRINPKVIILDHFDDTFPPISSNVYYEDFIDLINNKYPNIKLIIPEYNKEVDINNCCK